MFEFLGAHPQIYPSRIKEPYYFSPGNTRTLQEYLGLFAGATDEPWLIEASPMYLSAPDAPRLIREFSPDARAIVMVRDPVELIHSWHDRLTLTRRESSDARTAFEREDAERRYIRIARLGEQLERVLKVFPRDTVHVVVYDDFLADNAAAYRGVLQFLGVDPYFKPQFRTLNPSGEERSAAVQRLLWRDEGTLRAAARRLLPRSFRLACWRALSHLNRYPRPRPPLDEDLARAIWLRFEPDVELLSRLLDRDLVALWRH